jgi:3-oxoacyl-[acyl-carrier protein] reductase
MNLEIENQLFVVTGATSGIGKAIAKSLLNEGANLIINARKQDKLELFQQEFPSQIEIIPGDIMTDATLSTLIRKIDDRQLMGIVVNAEGPPAKSFFKTKLSDWDDAYETILRWKIKLTQEVIPLFQEKKYGRMLFIESSSVKQPIENLILSTSLRLAVVGFVKSLSQEVAGMGITLNILAPGYHATPRLENLYKNKALLLGISPEEAKKQFESETLSGKLGDPNDLASLACWLLSSKSQFITGQTISVDGGMIKSTFS